MMDSNSSDEILDEEEKDEIKDLDIFQKGNSDSEN